MPAPPPGCSVSRYSRYRGSTTGGMRSLAESCFSRSSRPVLRPFPCLFFLLSLLLCPFCFLLGTPLGAIKEMMSVWTPLKIQQLEDRPGSNAPNPLGVCIRHPVWVRPRRRLGGAICFVASCFLASLFSFVFALGTGATMTVLAPLSSDTAQVIGHAPTPSVESLETLYACCPRRWLDGVICFVASGWLAVVVCFACFSCRPISLFLSSFFLFHF